jgi:ceramide glucosyltransferase
MRPLWFFEVLAALGGLSGIGYYLLCILGARSFLLATRHRLQPQGSELFLPPVSILKPLHGTDPEIYDAFRSHCLQDYPEYEVIFGVRDPGDLAVAPVRRLIRDFPNLAIRLAVCPEPLGINPKVSNLVQMLPLAKYEYLIINDSDIRVPRNYLRNVLAPLAEPTVGMVTCMYRGFAARTLGSKLEAIGINTDYMAGVLAARQIEGMRFGMGSTLAFRRSVLKAIGGLEPSLDYLADDFEIGARIAAAGFEVRLSDIVVDHQLPAYSMRSLIEHQLRWGRSTRNSRPVGYAGVLLTFGLAWTLLALALSHGSRGPWTFLAVAALVRLAMALVVGRVVLKDRQVIRDMWLIPLRDLIALLVWIGSYAGRTVSWRGQQFILEKKKLRAV